MHYEQTQHGNPHQLSINQHVFPAVSIARFACEDGLVSTFLLGPRKEVRLAPRDKLFCALRVWNQAAESGFMKGIEDAFQALASNLLSRNIAFDLDTTAAKTASQFYALCRLRAEARENGSPDVTMKSALPERTLTKDEEEILEKKGYVFARGATIPGRHMASLRIQLLLGRLCPQETAWSVIHSKEIEFVVPDDFGEVGVIPLSPTRCLVANQCGGEISCETAIQINRLAISKSSKYYFARDFSKCCISVDKAHQGGLLEP